MSETLQDAMYKNHEIKGKKDIFTDWECWFSTKTVTDALNDWYKAKDDYATNFYENCKAGVIL